MVKEAKANRELSSIGRPGSSNEKKNGRSCGRSNYSRNSYYKQRSGSHRLSYGGVGTYASSFGGGFNNGTGSSAREG